MIESSRLPHALRREPAKIDAAGGPAPWALRKAASIFLADPQIAYPADIIGGHQGKPILKFNVADALDVADGQPYCLACARELAALLTLRLTEGIGATAQETIAALTAEIGGLQGKPDEGPPRPPADKNPGRPA